jgi:hypothetical protein
MDDAHTGQALVSTGPTEQLANNALAARCGAAAQAYPVERRVDRGCHEVFFSFSRWDQCRQYQR